MKPCRRWKACSIRIISPNRSASSRAARIVIRRWLPSAARNALKEAGVGTRWEVPLQAIGKAVAAGEPDGFVKTLYGAKNGELLGAHIVGPEATELIATLGVSLQAELTDEDIHATIFAHPTLSEAIHESMLASEGIAIHM